MLALLGLKDSYVSDGRVVTEFIKGDAIPTALSGDKVEELGAAYKQINASFGQFSLDTLCASTGALASNTLGRRDVHGHRERARVARRRSATRSPTRSGWPSGTPSSTPEARRQAGEGLDRPGPGPARPGKRPVRRSSPRRRPNSKDLDKIKHIVVIYEENHSFDNLYGGWEGVNGLANADAAHTHPGQPDRQRVRLPEAARREPRLAAALARRARRDARDRTAVHEPLPERAVHDRRLHRADRHDLPAEPDARVQPAERLAQRRPAALPGGCTRDLVHRFYQEQYQLDGGDAGPLRDRQRRGRPDDGLLRHDAAADLPVPARAGRPELRDRRQLLPGRVRRLVPQPPVADRGRVAGRSGRAHRRR